MIGATGIYFSFRLFGDKISSLYYFFYLIVATTCLIGHALHEKRLSIRVTVMSESRCDQFLALWRNNPARQVREHRPQGAPMPHIETRICLTSPDLIRALPRMARNELPYWAGNAAGEP